VIIIIGSKFYGDPLIGLDEVVSDAKYLLSQPEKVSLVMFTGGEDVHPRFYNGRDDVLCMTNESRDTYEKRMFDFCKHHNIKMTGICRGFQFLNVMSGGFMYQHIEGHTGPIHGAYFPYDGMTRMVTSTHHQLVGIPNDSIPVAWSDPRRSDIYMGPNGYKVQEPEHEIESAIFPNSNAMGVQYHPEMLRENDSTRIHYSNMIADFLGMAMQDFINKYSGGESHDRSRKAGNARRED